MGDECLFFLFVIDNLEITVDDAGLLFRFFRRSLGWASFSGGRWCGSGGLGILLDFLVKLSTDRRQLFHGRLHAIRVVAFEILFGFGEGRFAFALDRRGKLIPGVFNGFLQLLDN